MFTDAEMLGHLIHSFKFSCTGFSFNLRGHAIGEPYGKTKTTQQQQQKKHKSYYYQYWHQYWGYSWCIQPMKIVPMYQSA